MALLNDFISTVKNSGMMRTSRYSVIFPNAGTDNLVGLYCDQFTLPGLNINTQPCLTYGETREMPYQRLYNNINISFYVDTDMKVKKFFDDWMIQIQNPMNRTFSYYNDYTLDVTVNVEDLENNTKYSMMLHECYPKTIQDIQLDYNSKDIMKMTVTMAYRYWESSSRPIDSSPTFLNKTVDNISAEIQGVFNGVSSPLSVQYDTSAVASKLFTDGINAGINKTITGW